MKKSYVFFLLLMSFCASAQVRKEFPVKWEAGAWGAIQLIDPGDGLFSIKTGDINIYIDKTDDPYFVQKMPVNYAMGGVWCEYNWKYPWSFQGRFYYSYQMADLRSAEMVPQLLSYRPAYEISVHTERLGIDLLAKYNVLLWPHKKRYLRLQAYAGGFVNRLAWGTAGGYALSLDNNFFSRSDRNVRLQEDFLQGVKGHYVGAIAGIALRTRYVSIQWEYEHGFNRIVDGFEYTNEEGRTHYYELNARQRGWRYVLSVGIPIKPKDKK
ncbi:MAG: hypothetical protein KatS3mg033_2051 [Thermonema sp.]|uniref:hypothetical protein n=1 Tax=Thermonema sp. TaxID=2231181 RepID=UPI0021DD2421|nr:hypothetical protein [Thermonema sp.]GIV40251.1 MAG: hypothetical protein KatS3mg033_2051 [Thermonema sp.]